jgi:hypothetical protein
MSITRLAIARTARLAVVLALLALPHGAPAQGSPSAFAPSACAIVAGPDVSPSPSGVTSARTPAAPRADTAPAALRILASVTAAEVRFVGSPKICVTLTGDAQLDSVRVTGRRNLASPVVSGTTYRNVYVAVEIVGRLNAECIANRITGQRADSSSTARCASLGVKSGAGADGPP